MNEFRCGCKTNGFMIEYCPKHAAAPEMYESLKEMIDKPWSALTRERGKKALAKAEGK